MDMWEV
jgi:hypothetical protein